eukprot:3377105-Pleurochrysis_carterae.AAC.1
MPVTTHSTRHSMCQCPQLVPKRAAISRESTEHDNRHAQTSEFSLHRESQTSRRSMVVGMLRVFIMS